MESPKAVAGRRDAGCFDPCRFAVTLSGGFALLGLLAVLLSLALGCARAAPARQAGEVGPPLAAEEARELAAWRRALAADVGPGRTLVRRAVAAYYRGDAAAARRLLVRAAAAGAEVPRQLPPLLDGRASAAAVVSGEDGEPVVTVGEPVRVDLGGGSHQAAEPVLLAGPGARGDVLTVAWIDNREADAGGRWRIGLAGSEDGGVTWSETLLKPQPPLVTAYHGDPMAALDPRTGRRWVGAVSFFDHSGVWVAESSGPAAIGEPVPTFQGPADKSLLAAGPAPGNPASTRLYAAFNRGVQTSTDLGATWSAPVPREGFALGLQPRVGPAGELYVTYLDAPSRIVVTRSLDGGATFSAPDLVAVRLDTWDPQDSSHTPGTFRVAPIAALAVDPVGGTLYCIWSDTARTVDGDADLDLFLARSDDGGRTWSVPHRVLGGDGDQILPWIEVDHRGWLHLAFLDSRDGVQPDDAPSARLDAWYALSTDGGASWQEHRLTAVPFDTAGATWGADFDGRQFLGDYLGLAVSGDHAWVAYPAASPAGDLDLLVQPVALTVPCPENEALCLGGGRYRVEAEWRTPGGAHGVGHPVRLTADSGYLWFFRDTNVEVVAKVLDGCGVNGHHWVFAAGLTNVEVTLTVRDLETGETARYQNPQGKPFRPVTDTAALAGCK